MPLVFDKIVFFSGVVFQIIELVVIEASPGNQFVPLVSDHSGITVFAESDDTAGIRPGLFASQDIRETPAGEFLYDFALQVQVIQ